MMERYPWSGLPVYPVQCRVWNDNKGASVLLELPFAPYVGLLLKDVPSVSGSLEVQHVSWSTKQRAFLITAQTGTSLDYLIANGWKHEARPF